MYLDADPNFFSQFKSGSVSYRHVFSFGEEQNLGARACNV